MDLKEELHSICEKLAAVTDIVMALAVVAGSGGVVTQESLDLVSDVTFDCKNRLGSITTANFSDALAS